MSQEDVPDSPHQTITIEDVLDEDEPKNENPLIDGDIKKIAEQVMQDSTLYENLVLMKINGLQPLVPSIPVMSVVSMLLVGTKVVELEKAKGDSIFSSLPIL